MSKPENNGDIKRYTSANREAWNEVIPIHKPHRIEKDLIDFRDPNHLTLMKREIESLRSIGVSGKRVAHLSCNNGRELISVLRMGAESGVGFDISVEAIREAEMLIGLTGANARFVCTDVYDIGNEYSGRFDLAMITIGCMSWLPDIKRFYQITAGLLKPGGFLLISEEHPFVHTLSYEREERDSHFQIVSPYFTNGEALTFNDGIDYYGRSTYDAKTTYEFHHTLSDILNAIIGAGMNVTRFEEYPEDISNMQSHHSSKNMIPLSMIIVARKDG